MNHTASKIERISEYFIPPSPPLSFLASFPFIQQKQLQSDYKAVILLTWEGWKSSGMKSGTLFAVLPGINMTLMLFVVSWDSRRLWWNLPMVSLVPNLDLCG